MYYYSTQPDHNITMLKPFYLHCFLSSSKDLRLEISLSNWTGSPVLLRTIISLPYRVITAHFCAIQTTPTTAIIGLHRLGLTSEKCDTAETTYSEYITRVDLPGSFFPIRVLIEHPLGRLYYITTAVCAFTPSITQFPFTILNHSKS